MTGNFYKSNPLGKAEILLGTTKKDGFETSWTWDGFAKYVIAEAVHGNGTVLGRSAVTKSSEPKDRMVDAVQEEEDWLNEVTPTWWKVLHSPWFIAPTSIIIGASTLWAIYYRLRKLYAAWPSTWTWRNMRLKSAFSRGRYTMLGSKVQHIEAGPSAGESEEPLIEKDRRRRSEDLPLDTVDLR